MSRGHQDLVRALDDALESLELRGALAPLAALLLGHRALLGETLHQRLRTAETGNRVALDQLWLEGHGVRRRLDQTGCDCRAP